MAKYRVEIKRSAAKELAKLPAREQKRCLEVLEVLAINPLTELLQIKKLKGAESLYRVRFGDYRLVYEVQRRVLILVVFSVGHRKDIYR